MTKLRYNEQEEYVAIIVGTLKDFERSTILLGQIMSTDADGLSFKSREFYEVRFALYCSVTIYKRHFLLLRCMYTIMHAISQYV